MNNQEEPEFIKKLRKENEELKALLNLSEGEAALIQALRNGEIIEVFYGDVCQLIMEVCMPDAVYDALEKIQAEQKENNNE